MFISPGNRDVLDIKLPEITYFVDKGWMVLCFDYTGCYASDASLSESGFRSYIFIAIICNWKLKGLLKVKKSNINIT